MLLVASSRGSVKIDRDLSLKHVGPISLARLYGESCKEENVAVHFQNVINRRSDKFQHISANSMKSVTL